MKIRSANKDDCRKYFEWANDNVVRQSSFSPENIKWQEHVDWFYHRLRSDMSWMYVAIDDSGELIGQIRFDLRGFMSVEVDVSIATEYRNRGFGESLIKLGIKQLLLDSKIKNITALVKSKNQASYKAFTNSGFHEQNSYCDNDVDCICLLYKHKHDIG